MESVVYNGQVISEEALMELSYASSSEDIMNAAVRYGISLTEGEANEIFMNSDEILYTAGDCKKEQRAYCDACANGVVVYGSFGQRMYQCSITGNNVMVSWGGRFDTTHCPLLK